MANTTMSMTLEGKDVTRVTGPTMVGTILNWYLYGALTVQYVLYLLHSRNDKAITKVTVHLIFALDSLQTFLTMDDIFFWFVYGFGDVNRLFQFHWAFDVPTLDAIIGLIVQGVYCWRIWVLSGWRVLPIFCSFMSLLANSSGFAVGVQFQVNHKPGEGIIGELPSILWLLASAVVDITIACSMTYILLSQKRKASRARPTTGDRIMRLLTLILETNAITAAVAIATAIIFFIKPIAPPRTNFFQIGGFLLGKLYSNCFMVLLNQRHQGSGVRNNVTGSYNQQGSHSETSGFSIELGSKVSGRSGVATGFRSPRLGQLPSSPRTKESVNGTDYQSDVHLPVVKYTESRLGYQEPMGV